MKNKFILTVAAILFTSFAVKAQGAKIGYADVDYVLSEMPETKQAEKDLQSLNTQLQNQLQAKLKDYQTKLQAYQQGAANMAEQVRKNEELELTQMQQNLGRMEQESQLSLQKKQSELMQPITAKVGKAIEDVAKESGYDYILTAGVGGIDVVLYAAEKHDVSDLILKKMGITPSAK